MNILKTKLISINQEEKILQTYQKELFIKGSFIFSINNFNLFNTSGKNDLIYPKKKKILLQKYTYKNDSIYIHNFSKDIYLRRLLKIFLFLKKNKQPFLKGKVISCKNFFILIGFQGLILKININQFLSKTIKSYRKWKKSRSLYKLQNLLFFFQLNNKLQINLSRKIILKLLEKKNATI